MIILVVEDEPVTATHLEASLTEAGHEVLGPAPTAGAALELAERTRPDLALIDMDLKDGSNGVDLARTMLRRWNTAALIISGYPERARAHRDVAIGFIAKPYRADTVLASIEVVKAVRSGKSFSPMDIPPDFELF